MSISYGLWYADMILMIHEDRAVIEQLVEYFAKFLPGLPPTHTVEYAGERLHTYELLFFVEILDRAVEFYVEDPDEEAKRAKVRAFCRSIRAQIPRPGLVVA